MPRQNDGCLRLEATVLQKDDPVDPSAAPELSSTNQNGNRNGGLTLQGYGVLKAQFAAWTAGIRQRGE